MQLWILTTDGRVVAGAYTAAEALARAKILRDSPPDGLLDWGEGETPPEVEVRAERLRRNLDRRRV